MSSVYEALQRARRAGGAHPLRQPAATREIERSPVSLAPGPLATPLAPLFAAIRPLLDNRGGVLLHLVAATPGEGASTIAREFALLAGTTGHRRTLLVDADRRDPQSALAFGCDPARGLAELLWDNLAQDEVTHQVAGTMLSVACLVGTHGRANLDADTLREVYGRLRQQFELIIVDCPPVGEGYSNLLPESADGIILVVQAEKTRPAVIARAKDQVEQAGGKVLGAVLNRRTNYIPNFLYKLL